MDAETDAPGVAQAPAPSTEQHEPHDLLCPSAQPDWPNAQVIGIVGGVADAPRVGYLTEPQSVSQALLDLTIPLQPTEVLRIAARCATHACQHFSGGHCQLVARTVQHLEPVVSKLPACGIRASCRWWNEHGRAACLRCPQVVTDSLSSDAILILVATPPDPHTA